MTAIAWIPPGQRPRMQRWKLQGIIHALKLGIMEH